MTGGFLLTLSPSPSRLPDLTSLVFQGLGPGSGSGFEKPLERSGYRTIKGYFSDTVKNEYHAQ